MPRQKSRKAGDNIRISKGKCASEINFDITEQCVDEEKNDLNSDEEFRAKTDEEPSKVDRRTFDEIMIDAFEEFNSKSSRIRSNALTAICTQLQLSHNPAFLAVHIDRLLTIVENGLQSNNPCEMDMAATLISLATIQLLDSKLNMQVFYKPLKALVKAALHNENLKSSVRSAVCHAMGILVFLYETSINRIREVMQEFQDIFMPNPYHQPYMENKPIQTANNEFQIAACETWTFLVTLLPSRTDCTRTPTYSFQSVDSIFGLLESPCYNMRVASAKAVAVVFECGLDCDKIYLKPHLTKIIKKISVIVNAWNKNTSDIKSTPEVLQYLEVSWICLKSILIQNRTTHIYMPQWQVRGKYSFMQEGSTHLCHQFLDEVVFRTKCFN